MNVTGNKMIVDNVPSAGEERIQVSPHMLDLKEYLSTIRIPNSQRAYTGSDSGECYLCLMLTTPWHLFHSRSPDSVDRLII